MSTALYRRYRPETFDEVIGQEHVTEPLMAALAAGRVTHAYLFSGPRGCGKTSSARIFARCLNCAEGPTPTPCGTCDSCQELGRGGSGSLDVVEIDAASHNGVDDARDLRERAVFAPARDRFKIFILDEAHMVTTQGFNALLKLVEEPPEHVKFIFATTEPEKVIGTIRSRTHHYPFRLVPPGTLTTFLESLCVRENVEVSAGVIPMVVRAGGGSVRDSLSVLDQLMAGSVGRALDYERAAALLGYTSATLLDDAVAALATRDGGALFTVVDRMVQSGHDPRRFVEDLLQRLRDLVIIAVAGDAADAALGPVPADQRAQMQEQARLLGARAASRAADLTNAALSEMTGATSPRLQLELLCARLLITPESHSAPAPAQREEPQPRPAPPTPEPGPAVASPPADESARHARREPPPPAAAPQRRQEPPPQPEPTSQSQRTPGDRGAVGLAAAARRATQALRGAENQAVREVPPTAATASPAAPRGSDSPRAEPSASSGNGISASDRPSESSEPTAGQVDTAMLRRRWSEVLATLAQIRRASWVLVDQSASPGEVRDGVMSLVFETEGLKAAFINGHHADNVAAALRETLGLSVRIEAETGSAASGSTKAGSEPDPGPPPPDDHDREEPESGLDDGVSADDETIEESVAFGVPVIERLLGGTLIEKSPE